MKHDYAGMIAVLEAARKLIDAGVYTFVCNAIIEVIEAPASPYSFDAGQSLHHWIDSGLEQVVTYGNSKTVTKWLTETTGRKFTEMSDEMRSYRLAWIDDMILNLKG